MAAKTCSRCGTEYPATSEYFSKDARRVDGLRAGCKNCNAEASKEYYAANKGRLRTVALDRYNERKDDPAFRKKARRRSKRYRDQQRKQCIEAYGGKCACCGESRFEFLAIDHVNGGGGKHRIRAGGSSGVVRELISEGFPDGFRVLCHNCNMAIGMYGSCPHERQTEREAD